MPIYEITSSDILSLRRLRDILSDEDNISRIEQRGNEDILLIERFLESGVSVKVTPLVTIRKIEDKPQKSNSDDLIELIHKTGVYGCRSEIAHHINEQADIINHECHFLEMKRFDSDKDFREKKGIVVKKCHDIIATSMALILALGDNVDFQKMIDAWKKKEAEIKVPEINVVLERNQLVKTIMEYLVSVGTYGDISAEGIADRINDIYPGFLKKYNELIDLG